MIKNKAEVGTLDMMRTSIELIGMLLVTRKEEGRRMMLSSSQTDW